ncbi:MAG: substrate-binding domain-containing protein [Brachybacterium sp.]|uniref:LacI family DNA-binding transcriptional regulator n=1 Tax=Brachybacterium sp. TaxID=1891286 RepID=UPI002648D24C|nr:substrate-binding domain-containing protein [Brachybacterium sp.]MDN5686041.1 substrate-binding domain-containing protein [Brachybacterium sp.]
MVLLNADELMARHGAFRALVRGHRVDGLLIQSGFAADSHGLQEVARSVPSVVFNADRTPGLRTVRLDDTTAATMATKQLLELGHRRIAFVGAEGTSSDRRFRGYLDALDDAGIAAVPMIAGGWDAGSARAGIERYFAAGGRATGLVVVTSTSALGVHAGVIAAGPSLPGDVSVVSIHDTWFTEHLNPPLTVLELPLAEIGQRAVDLLIEQIASPTEGAVVLEEPAPRLIERGSTSAPRETGA